MMAGAPVLFFSLELPDAIVYKCSTAFVDFNFTFLFSNVFSIYSLVHVKSSSLMSVVERAISSASAIVIFSFLVSLVFRWRSLGSTY